MKENFPYMKNSEILPPDTYAIDKEVDDLFKHGDVTAVSMWSKIRYARLAAMLRVDDPQENCVSETFALWYGMLKNNPESARKFYRMFERQAEAWKLIGGSPLAILQAATERIPQIQPQEIKQLSDEDQLKVLSYVTVLRKAIEDIADAWCSAREHSSQPIGG